MTKILELRETLRKFFGRFELYIRPVLRFVVALVTFLLINQQLGYMRRLNNPLVAIALAVLCGLLPSGATAVLGALLILVHLYGLCVEAAIIGVLLFLALFFLYFKYAPKHDYTMLMTAVLSHFRISEVIPTAAGLRKHPYTILSMICGLVIYHFLNGIRENEGLLGAVEENADVSKFTLCLQSLTNNNQLYLTVAAFALTTLLVYLIRRQAMEQSWTIGVLVGNGANLLVLIVGGFLLGSTERLLWNVLGTVVAVAVGLLMEFFLFHLDYARVERVQFEDDEYYYYVKAVPKVFVSNEDKRVKQINSRKNGGFNKRELADEFDISQDLLDD